MAKITESLSASIKEKVFGVVKAKASSGESPDALLKVISKNFMAMSAMARDMNVASQNIKELVKVMGGKPSDTEDKVAGSGLTPDERERKLDVELEKDKSKEESKKESKKPSLVSKLGKKALDKFKATKVGKKVTDKFAELKKVFNPAKIFKALTKYLVIGAIIGVVFVAFKDTFVEWATGLFDAIKIKFDEFTASIGQWFQDTIQPIIDKAKELIKPVIDAISGFITKIGDWFKEKFELIKDIFVNPLNFIKKIIDKVFVLFDKVKEGFQKFKDTIKPYVEKALDTPIIKYLPPVLALKALTGAKSPEEKKEEEKKPASAPAPAPAPKVPAAAPKVPAAAPKAPHQPKHLEPAPPPAPIVVPGPMPAPAAPKEKAKPKAPSVAPAPTPSAPPGAQKPTAEPAKIPGGTPGLVVGALNDAGITSPKAHANVLATVKAESNFRPQSESLFYRTAKQIAGKFGKKRIPSEEFAQQFVSSKGDNRSELLANHVYKSTDGNSAPGDGFKYRGRGFIQHTGKNQYAAISKATGTDLLSNPDALNSPEVASKAIAWFFLNYKRLKPKDMENISKVNKAVGFADDKAGTQAKKREASAQQIQAEGLKGVRRSGTQVASASSDVASGQRQQQKSQTPVVVNAPTTNTQIVKKTQVASSKRSDVGSSLANAAA
jgi:predicted chitinase